MPVYVNRNINNKWTKVEVTDAEVDEIAIANFKRNVEIARNVLTVLPKKLKKIEEGQTPPSDALIEKLISVFVKNMITPLHFSIENWVDAKLSEKANAM